MFRTSLFVCLLACTFLFTACAVHNPPRRVGTGVALPRAAIFDASGKKEEHHKFAFGANTSRTNAYDDTGESQQANTASLFGEYSPLPNLAFGGRPYISDVLGVESGLSLGFETFLRWRALASESFHLSLFPSYRYTKKKNLEKFCRDTAGFLATNCPNNATIAGYAEAEVSEPGLSVFFEFYHSKGNNHSLALVPAIYYSRVTTRNHLEGYTGDFEYDFRPWNYSGMIYHNWRWGGGRAKFLAQAGGGFAFNRQYPGHGGRSNKRVRELLGDITFTVGF